MDYIKNFIKLSSDDENRLKEYLSDLVKNGNSSWIGLNDNNSIRIIHNEFQENCIIEILNGKYNLSNIDFFEGITENDENEETLSDFTAWYYVNELDAIPMFSLNKINFTENI